MQAFEKQVDYLCDLYYLYYLCYLCLVQHDYADDSQRVDDLTGDSDLVDDHGLPYEAAVHHLWHVPNESHAILLVSILADRFHYECNDESFQWISESQKGLLGPGCSSAETVRGVSLEEWNPW